MSFLVKLVKLSQNYLNFVCSAGDAAGGSSHEFVEAVRGSDHPALVE